MILNIKETKKQYESEIDAVKKEIAGLPKGQMTKKGTTLYVTIGANQKGITKDKLKVRQLARKAYLLQRLKHLEWNYSLAKTHEGRYKTEDPADIIKELPSFYQTLPTNYFFHPSVNERADSSTREGDRENVYHPEQLIYLTNSGIRVRSKSERTIADILSQNGIPYSYEAKYAFGGEIKSPDFTINRPYDGKLFLWEHFGLIEQEEYSLNANKKLTLYNRHGFYPFKNLICTYEEDLQNPVRIQAIIEVFLLK